MPECVSCGREIPVGKFFCEDCYVKMKGKRGPSGELPRSPREQPGQPPVAADAPGADVTPPQAAAVETVVPMVKASGTLTPASSKKVISMKPSADKVPKEKAAKEKVGKKRIKVTISFSERTYDALARLRGGKGSAGQEPGAEVVGPSQPHPKGVARRGRVRGKPRLQAVSEPGAPARSRSGFRKAIAYRDRALDGKDMLAIAMAAFAVLAIIILSFQPWVRVSWGGGDGTSLQTVEVTGMDLGTLTYVCMAIAVTALLYAVATWIFKGIFMEVDYGVVFIAAGILFSLLLFIIIASNTRFLIAAVQKAGMSTEHLPAQFEMQRLFPAYAMVIAGAILGFAGLIRISERKASRSGETSG
jgi:hypothetical protein